MQSDSTTNCEEQMKSRHKTTLHALDAAAKQNDEEEINSYCKTTLHALDAAAKRNKIK
jgi:ribosomal protein S20